jgi:tRNA A-37 threonylcarbamoyl transferase component Bud32
MEERDGLRVVVKRNKPTKEFHELIISYTYSLISILLAHPSSPLSSAEMMTNEGRQMRIQLDKAGIPTPKLISISDDYLIEEFIEGGDLYAALLSDGPFELAYTAGAHTGRLHKAGWAFIDNKAQNYLVRDSIVLRTDLGFTRKEASEFARSMDIGSFLASVMDLGAYPKIEKEFLTGYSLETGRR